MNKPISYLQTDPKWGKKNYSSKGEKRTIGSSGCGPTAAAMVVASLADQSVTPLVAANWSMEQGYKIYNQGTSYNFFLPYFQKYGIEANRLTSSGVYGKPNDAAFAQAKLALQAGKWILACAGKGNWTSSGHFILVYGYENGYVYINDPASTKPLRLKNTWELFAKQMKHLWEITVPETSQTEPVITEGTNYTKEQFISEVCTITGTTTAKEALKKTVTISEKTNKNHTLVTPLERYLKQWGMYSGIIEADQDKQPSFGANMTKAVNSYQESVMRYSDTDGEITAKGTMWAQMLGIV